MPEATIRKATVADLDAILNLWQELMEFHRQRNPHFALASDGREQFTEFIAGHMKADTSCVLVAAEDGEVAGYCLAMQMKYPPVFAQRDCGLLSDLAVTARCRRHGLGERLYRTAQSWFANRNIRRIEVRVTVSNEVSTAFWKKMGFAPFVMTVCKHI